MGEPLQKPSDDKISPEFETVIPESTDGSVDNFLNEFEKYQKKLDTEWEKTKENYQSQINQVMDEYLNQKFLDKEFKSEPEKPKSDVPPTPTEAAPAFDHKMESLLARVERELRRSGKSRGFSLFDDWGPTIINVPSRTLRGLIKKALGIMAIAGVIILAVYSFFIYPNNLAVRTPLPYSHASGVFVSGNKIYLTDWFRKGLFIHQLKRGLPIVSVENIPNNFITGLALTEKNLWTLDGFDGKIIRHSLTEEHQAVEKFPAPGPKPMGIFFDGTDLWTADTNTKFLYQHKITDIETPFNQFEFPKMTITGFFLDKNRVWALDGENREIHLFRLQNPLKSLGIYDLDPFLGGSIPTGIARTGDNLLLITTKPPQIIRIPMHKLGKLPKSN